MATSAAVVANPLRLSLHQTREQRKTAAPAALPMASSLLGDGPSSHRTRFVPPPPLAEEGGARATRRKELMLDDEVLDSDTWEPRRWSQWKLWVYYTLVTLSVGTLWIVGQWPFMLKRLHLLLSTPARQDNADFKFQKYLTVP